MRREALRPVRALLALGVCAGVAGCLAGPAPRDHYYRLEVAPPSAGLASAPLRGTLEVERLRSDALTQERPILRREAGAVEVAPYAYAVWIDSPTLLVQQQLAAFLRSAGVADAVVTPELGVGEDWVVTGRLDRLEQVSGAGDARVEVELELAARRADRGTLLLRKSYRAEQATGGDDPAAAVRGFAAALHGIFESFAADLAAAAPAR
jgi:ABC-type uncharacterized transport system auxiliary subunit